LPDSEEVLDAARAATEEISTVKPRKGVVVALLKSIANGVATTVDLVGVVAPLVDAAAKLLH